MATEAFRAPRGTSDILPPASLDWWGAHSAATHVFFASGYDPIETPMFEHTEVFERGVGEASEVVNKQMYTFTDQGGRSLTLRPEGTAPVVRAVLEHNLHRASLPVKLFYIGPFFRQERPQKGRFRQFFQAGVEAIGSDDPAIDAEVIELGARFLRTAGVDPALYLNSIGHLDSGCRRGYLDTLVAWLRERRDELAAEDRDRIDTNPLRTFDSKEARTIAVMEGAPLITDHLCDDCRRHFEEVQELLASLGVPFTLEPRLVRGLDYYTRTAFEFVAGGLGSQNAVGGGGRYDGLSESLGGPPLPGIGFALGIDRILIAGTDPWWNRGKSVSAYVVTSNEVPTAEALKLAGELRVGGLRTHLDVMGRSLKAQMKDANRVGATFTIILGQDELSAGVVTVKDMRSADQERLPREGLVLEILRRGMEPAEGQT